MESSIDAEVATNNALEVATKPKQGPTKPLSDEDWEAIKIANIAGMSDTEISERWEVLETTLRSRRSRDAIWAEAFQAMRKRCNERATKGQNSAISAKKAAENITNSVSDLSQNNLLVANQLAGKLVSRALSASEAVPLDTVADIEKAVKIASIAGKWNQPTVAINQAFAFGDAGEGENGVVIETEEGDEGPVIECEE